MVVEERLVHLFGEMQFRFDLLATGYLYRYGLKVDLIGMVSRIGGNLLAQIRHGGRQSDIEEDDAAMPLVRLQTAQSVAQDRIGDGKKAIGKMNGKLVIDGKFLQMNRRDTSIGGL